MRFPLASLFCLAVSFVFAVVWLVLTFLLETISDAMTPAADLLSPALQSRYLTNLSHIQMGFGVVCVIFLLVGIILFYVLEALGDEPEQFYRE